MATIGDTVRFKATFYDWEDALTDPTEIIVKIYDSRKVQLGETITLDMTENKESTGVYFYDYVVPAGHTRLYYEFNGVVGGLPSVERGEIRVSWL
jgi:hypothetical protein